MNNRHYSINWLGHINLSVRPYSINRHINDLTADLKCNVKLFADNTSLFTVVRESNIVANDMDHALKLISQWAQDWRMSFNPDPRKQAVELLFSRKRNELDHSAIHFNNIPVEEVNEHKHLANVLGTKLSFSVHIRTAISKSRKGIGLLKCLSNYLPRSTLNKLSKGQIRFLCARRSVMDTRRSDHAIITTVEKWN